MSTRPRDRPGESGGVRGCPPHLGLRVDAEKAVKKDPNTPVICPSQRRESFRLARRPRRLRADASESATREKRRSRARDDSRTDPRSRRYAASDPPRGERWPFLTFSAKSPSRGDSTPRAAHAHEASLFPGSERRTFTTRRHPCPSRARARARARPRPARPSPGRVAQPSRRCRVESPSPARVARRARAAPRGGLLSAPFSARPPPPTPLRGATTTRSTPRARGGRASAARISPRKTSELCSPRPGSCRPRARTTRSRRL